VNRETIQKREEIAWRLERIWGRQVSAKSVSYFIHLDRDPLPATIIRKRVIVYREDLEAWALRQIQPATAAVKKAAVKKVRRRAPRKTYAADVHGQAA
jgi:hypothetical protein